jgi:prephenate dehydrogenase
MRTWDTVAIIGVGLIGGSIGLALAKRKLARRIVGIGRTKASLDSALARGCITEAATSIADGVRQADLIVVCTPVGQIAQHVAEAGQHMPEGSVITDAGSTKAELVVKAEAALADRFSRQMPFVGSHPLAGSEKNGPEASSADLLEGRVVVVTETDVSHHDVVDTIDEFWQSLGARVVRMSPGDHDAAMASTSHLPHLLASALAVATPHDFLPLTATGWQDTTRIASGDVELWQQIFQSNRSRALKALADFETVLAQFHAALEAGDEVQLAKLLAEGKRRRDAVGS